MRLFYLDNSGFALEKDGALVVMDCYNPREHSILSRESLKGYGAVTVLSSHAHSDHFTPEIYHLPCKAAFVNGFDIPAYPGAISLEPGETHRLNGMEIRAFGSTDEGVSFFLQWQDGSSLFHAGDLNNWHWQDESDKAFIQQAEQDFFRVLHSMQPYLGDGELQIALFPVDPRMGTDYYRGAVQFAEMFRPRVLIPMHFGSRFQAPQAFFEEMAPYTEIASPEKSDAPVPLPHWEDLPG